MGDAPGALLRALERFRSRPGRGSGVTALLKALDKLEMRGASRRREELVSSAVESGDFTRFLAERVYDIADEEGLEPAFAYELVRSQVAVCGPQPGEPVTSDDTLVEGTPEWIAPEAAMPRVTVELVRERRLRMSFRRLRSHLETCETAEDALAAFVAEPDVGDCGYLLD
jgi:hypothetical protein